MSLSETSKTLSHEQSFDVVIVGGGMVGASLSLLLNDYMNKGLRVALIDGHDISHKSISNLNMQQPSFDERTTAISLGSQRILEQLNVWGLMQKTATPIEHIQVSQQKQFGRVRLHANDVNVPALGYVVENKSIGTGLQTALLGQDKLTVFAPADVVSYKPLEQGVELELSVGDSKEKQTIITELLVLADGVNSLGCRQLGIDQSRYEYDQHAIVCNVSFDQNHKQWAYERFTQSGPLALLPMGANRFALVWCMDSEQVAERLACNSEVFRDELQKLISFDKGRITQVGERASYPLALVQANEQVRHRIVVLGNAAHALHPVAGQGFNLALRDAKALANTIATQLNDPGKLSGLQEYAKHQQSDQSLTTSLSHTLPTKFSEQGLHWSLLRGLAMTAMDVLPTAKQLFANQAMGLVGKAKAWRP